MSLKGIKSMIVGEQMPDPHAPENRERAERERNAGKKFASMTHIDKAGAKAQSFACRHRTLFLVIVFGIILLLTTWNVYRLVMISRYRAAQQTVLLQHKEKAVDPAAPRPAAPLLNDIKK